MTKSSYGMIYADCDGTLNEVPRRFQRILKKFPESLYGFFAFLKGYPRKEVIKTLRKAEDKGFKIIIITARFKVLENRLKNWLDNNNIPYSKLICIGPFRKKAKKLKIIKQMKIQYGIDNEKDLRKESQIQIFSPDNPYKLLREISNHMAV